MLNHLSQVVRRLDARRIVRWSMSLTLALALSLICAGATRAAGGDLDPTFQSRITAQNTVYAVASQPDGKILIGGFFTKYNGATANYVVRLMPTLKAFAFSTTNYTVFESETPPATITVNRYGDTTQAASVQYSTSDSAGLANCNVASGNASARCDYTAVGGTLNFAPGQSSLTFIVPIINDAYIDSNETLALSLSNPSTGMLITLGGATLTIFENDFEGIPNPVDNNQFFIRQLYLDFLNREPEPPGIAAWLNILNNCAPGDIRCDKIEVASAFFRSPESFDRSYFIYRFYEAALGRQPQYDEYQNDLRSLTGFLTPEEAEERKRQFVEAFVNRQEFRNLYNSKANGQPFVDAVLATAGAARPGVGAATVVAANRADVINRLAANQITRGQALRELLDSAEVSRRFFNKAFVVVEYFGFLRRNPDINYLHWIDVLNTTGDYREMIRGFMQSPEYRSRFGPAN